MICEVCLSACEICHGSRAKPHMLEHSMKLAGATWRCRKDHRLDADPVHVMTANGAPRMF